MVRLSEFLAEQGKGTYKNCKKKSVLKWCLFEKVQFCFTTVEAS